MFRLLNEKLRTKNELERAKEELKLEEEWKQRELVKQKKAKKMETVPVRASRNDGMTTGM